MAQLETTAWQYLRCPEAFFATHEKDLFFIFNIQQEIVRSGAQSRNLSTPWYDFTPPGRGKWYEKIFITFDFHIFTLTESH